MITSLNIVYFRSTFIKIKNIFLHKTTQNNQSSVHRLQKWYFDCYGDLIGKAVGYDHLRMIDTKIESLISSQVDLVRSRELSNV